MAASNCRHTNRLRYHDDHFTRIQLPPGLLFDQRKLSVGRQYARQVMVRCRVSALRQVSYVSFDPASVVLICSLAKYMYDALGVQWATSVLGFIAIALIPVPMV